MNYVPALINNTYPIVLPEFRHDFHRDRPNWERGRLESCAELMKPGMVVVDVGAECGDFTSLYKKWVGDDGDVVPVEPATHQWPFIKGTWEANGFNEPPELAWVGLIADREYGNAAFACPSVAGWPKESDGEGTPDGGFVHLKHALRVDTTTLDQIAVWTNPDVVVIDVEGAEWNVLNGGWGILERCRPYVYVSVHDVSDDPGWPGSLQGWYGKTADDIDRLMEECEYNRDILPSYGEAERFFLYTPR